MNNHYFNQFPWNELEDAYGKAIDAPIYLFDLIGNDEEAREEAVNDYLFAKPWHQYSVYSSTPYAVKCVLHIIEKENISNLFVGTEPLVLYLLKFICLCRDGAESDDKLKKSILDGKPTYYECLDHPNSKVSKVAGKLIRFCYLE